MPSLNSAQKQQVASWVNEGLSLSEVQKRIAAELGVSMTYMDVRFLVDDLDLTLVDKTPPPPPATPDSAPVANELPGDVVEPAPPPEGLAPEPAPASAGTVKVSVDPIQRPGVLVGGSVTFSDGQSGQWQMDEYGRLGFVPPHPGYKPAPADVQQFQTALDAELRKLGY